VSRVAPFGGAADAGGEDDNAPGARDGEAASGRDFHPADRHLGWGSGVDGEADAAPCGGGGLSDGIAADQTDAALESRLFSSAGKKIGHRRHADPDWAAIHRELKRKHVTLTILWDEYIVCHPDGYRYSRFCELYRAWEGRLSVTMRQAHRAGDKLFVDYAGDTIAVVIDRLTGRTCPAQFFVAVLGASSFLYADALHGSYPVDRLVVCRSPTRRPNEPACVSCRSVPPNRSVRLSLDLRWHSAQWRLGADRRPISHFHSCNLPGPLRPIGTTRDDNRRHAAIFGEGASPKPQR